MKTDDPGFLDLKLVIVANSSASAAWQEAVGALGEAESPTEAAGWTQTRVLTSAKLRDLAIRVTCFVGPPTADGVAGYVSADRIISDGATELPEVSLANVPRATGPASRETLLSSIKEILREAASAS